MNKYIKLAAVTLCLSFPVFTQAQKIVAGYSLGQGKYVLNDLKTMQENSVKSIQETYKDYKSTETFPDGLFHDAFLGVKFSFHEIGLKYDYFTTGGRNHLADYSGEIKEDVIVNGDAIGLYYKIHFLSLPLNSNFRLSANAGVSTGAIYNRVKNSAFFTIYDPKSSYHDYGGGIISVEDSPQDVDESTKFRSTNWYVQPNIGIQLWFKNTISLNINAGYLFDNQGKLQTGNETTYYDDYGYYYASAPGREYDLGVDWTGLRLSVGISFAFSIVK
jgi:hypothetical protein